MHENNFVKMADHLFQTFKINKHNNTCDLVTIGKTTLKNPDDPGEQNRHYDLFSTPRSQTIRNVQGIPHEVWGHSMFVVPKMESK